jgi:hemoglobin
MTKLPLPTLALVLFALCGVTGCHPAAKSAAKPAAKKPPADERTLYDRIGGEATIVAIVDDLMARAAADPKVNFTRTGTTRPWQATPDNLARLRTRLIQFLGTATGGPHRYEGEDMRTAHRGMSITRGEFDAFVADVRASLETVGVKEKERKELLAIIESARGTVVESPQRR